MRKLPNVTTVCYEGHVLTAKNLLLPFPSTLQAISTRLIINVRIATTVKKVSAHQISGIIIINILKSIFPFPEHPIGTNLLPGQSCPNDRPYPKPLYMDRAH